MVKYGLALRRIDGHGIVDAFVVVLPFSPPHEFRVPGSLTLSRVGQTLRNPLTRDSENWVMAEEGAKTELFAISSIVNPWTGENIEISPREYMTPWGVKK